MADEEKKETASEISKEEKWLQIGAFASVFFVCVVIGIPLWWKTTEVYRVGLPYSMIDQQSTINELPITLKLEVVVPAFVNDHKDFITTLQDSFQSIFDNEDYTDNSGDPQVSIIKQLLVRPATEQELLVLQAAASLKETDEKLRGVIKSSSGCLSFFILPHRFFTTTSAAVVVGLDRSIFVKLSEPAEMAEQMNHVMEKFYIQREAIERAFHGNKFNDELDRGSMTSLPSSSSIDVIFTLVHPGGVGVAWDASQAIEKHLTPMLQILKPHVTFSTRSQIIHLLSIPSKFSRTCQCHALSWDSLPHIINPIEPYLASHITDNPILNFVTYIPSESQSPLTLFHQSGQASTTNSFLVPRWGGILVHNLPPPTHQTSSPPTNQSSPPNTHPTPPPPSDLKSKHLFSVFIPQLKNLIGFQRPSYYHDHDVDMITSAKKLIPNWELDSWLLHRSIENIVTSSSSMTSLKQLLTLINNMVINDDVGIEVYTSVNSTFNSLLHLSRGNLSQAHAHSLTALQSSEKAFFDHSLLGLLYFPEDQKFAIYLPLFFPLGIPIVVTFFQTLRYVLKLRKENKNKSV